MQVELTPYEGIILEGALRDSYVKHVAHYREAGCPGIMKEAVTDWLDSAREAHQKLVAVLRAEGYLMTRAELEEVDHAALMDIPWTPPPHTPNT